jgi:hypothetical protein
LTAILSCARPSLSVFPAYPVAETATLLLAFVEGRIAHFVRGGFRDSPMEGVGQAVGNA